MSTPRDFDRIASTWLADGPSELADRVLDAALEEVHLTHQRRRRTVPWRTPTLNTPLRLVAAFAIVAVVGYTRLTFLNSSSSSPGATATSSPTSPPSSPTTAPTPAPTTAVTTIDRTAEDGYSITVPLSWHSRAYSTGLFFSAPAPITSAAMWVSPVTAGEYAIDVGEAYGGSPYRITGHTVTELLASVNSVYRALNSAEGAAERQVTIDGEPAWVTEHAIGGPPNLWIDAVVIHGDRAYNLTMDAPPAHAQELRAAFDEIMASIRWAP